MEKVSKVLIEAAAASRAIVTTNISGCRDALIPNKTGLLIPANNPNKLANAIQWHFAKILRKEFLWVSWSRKFEEREFPIKKLLIITSKLPRYNKINNII